MKSVYDRVICWADREALRLYRESSKVREMLDIAGPNRVCWLSAVMERAYWTGYRAAQRRALKKAKETK